MADKKKASKVEAGENEAVIRTATHTLIRTEQGALVSCVENESGDEVAVPVELAYLVN